MHQPQCLYLPLPMLLQFGRQVKADGQLKWLSRVGFKPTPPHGDQKPHCGETLIAFGVLDPSGILNLWVSSLAVKTKCFDCYWVMGLLVGNSRVRLELSAYAHVLYPVSARWQPHQLTSHCRANYPAGWKTNIYEHNRRNYSRYRSGSVIDQHGNRPSLAPEPRLLDFLFSATKPALLAGLFKHRGLYSVALAKITVIARWHTVQSGFTNVPTCLCQWFPLKKTEKTG